MKGTKNMRNKEQGKNWQKVKLGDVAKSISETYDFKDKEKVIFINTGDIFDGKFLHKDFSLVNKLPGQAKKRIKKKDILFSEIRPKNKRYAFVTFSADDYVVSTKLMIIRSNDNIVPKYLYQLLKRKKTLQDFQTIAESRSGTFPQITFDSIKDYPVLLPGMEEQKRIVKFLNNLDDKIELNNKTHQTLEQMAQAIFKEWFDKDIDDLPKGWKAEKLNQLVKTQYGYTESASDKKIGPKFLRVTDINKTNWIDWNNVPYCKINKEDFDKYKLNYGDVVIARMADPGKVAIIEDKIDAVFASYLIRLGIIDKNVLPPYYLYYFMRSEKYQNFIFGASTGTTRRSANAKVITDCMIPIPPKKELDKFEKIVTSIRNLNIEKIHENQTLSSLRDTLLPKLMSGKVRV